MYIYILTPSTHKHAPSKIDEEINIIFLEGFFITSYSGYSGKAKGGAGPRIKE